MSPDDPTDAVPDETAAMIARARALDMRAGIRWRAVIGDLWLDDRDRPDDRLRTALHHVITRDVADTMRLLGEDGAASAQETVVRLARAGLLADALLAEGWTREARLAILAEGLSQRMPDASWTSPIEHEIGMGEGAQEDARSSLSEQAFRRLAYGVAAVLCERGAHAETLAGRVAAAVAGRPVDAGRAAAAARVAAAIDADRDALPALIDRALQAADPLLAAALIAHAMGIDIDDAIDLLIDVDGDRLWLALRALDLPRAALAPIALVLSDADARRDIDGFAERFDAIAAIPPDTAAAPLADLALPPEFRAARRSLERNPVA